MEDADTSTTTDATWAPQSPDLDSYIHPHVKDEYVHPHPHPHPHHRSYRPSISTHFSQPTFANSTTPYATSPPQLYATSPALSSPIVYTKHPQYPQSHSASQNPYDQLPPASAMPRGVKREAAPAHQDHDYSPEMGRGKRAEVVNYGEQDHDEDDHIDEDEDAHSPDQGTDHIVIKNHFPVARIKRIMQADDDVGKVAQVTPVVVCKSSTTSCAMLDCQLPIANC